MNISESKQGNVTILKAQGKLDSMSSPELDKRLTSLVENGTRQIALDLAGLDYVSSAGLRNTNKCVRGLPRWPAWT